MIYVYAITAARPERRDAGPGIGDASVALHTRGPLAAICSRHDHPTPPEPTRDNALRHGHVVDQWLRHGPLLPARFGTTFRLDESLDALLDRNRGRLLDGLARVRGHAEWGVRVLWTPEHAAPDSPTPVRPESGREYLLARAAHQRERDRLRERAEHLARQIDQPLSAMASAGTRRILPSPQLLLSGAYLVPDDDTPTFHDKVQSLTDAHSDLRIFATGPWPPYHFTPPLDTAEVAHA
jgi:hypothetical protein